MGTLFLGCASAPLALSPVPTAPIPASLPAEPPRLEKGTPVEREIHEGETHEYRILANAGDYARVTVDQTKVDVAVRLVGPAGEEIATADGVGGRKEPELLSWIAEAGGDWRLQVGVHGAAGSGVYKISLEDLRPSRTGDSERLQAERIFTEASHLRALRDSESLRKAAAKFEESLALWQKAGDPASEIETLNRIGAIDRFLGETEAALALSQRALSLAIAVGDREGEAKARNNLGIARHQLGQGQEAVKDLEAALHLWETLGKSEQAATTSYSLGVVQFSLGEMESALSAYEHALEIRRAAGNEETQAEILTGIASIYRDRGEGDKALELYAQALDLSRKVQDQVAEAYVLHNMAHTYVGQGDFQKALDLYAAARALAQTFGDRPLEAWLLYSLGATSLHLGDTDRALKYYELSLQIYREAGGKAWEAYVLRDIGWVYQVLEKPEMALEQYSKAYAVSREAENRRGEAMSLYGMGRANIDLKRPAEAVGFLDQALARYRDTEDAIGEINCLLDLGRAYEALGENTKALAHLQRAVELSRQHKALMTQASAQAALAKFNRSVGNLAAASTAIEEALKIIESVRPKVASQRQRVSFFASRRDYYDFYIDLQMQLHKEDPAGSHLTAAMAASERARARALLDILSEGKVDLRHGVDPELKKREEEVANRITLLQNQFLDNLSLGGSRAARIETDLDRAEQEQEEIEWQIKRDHPRYASIQAPEILPPERIQRMLDGRSAFLEYSVGRESSYLFVATADRLQGYRLPAVNELAEKVDNLRALIQEPGRRNQARFVEAAHRLYELLIAPAEGMLQHKSRLIISPDGPLLLLSFEALLTSSEMPPGGGYEDLAYLIRERSISYIPSASVFAELGSSGQAARRAMSPELSFLGFADPDYKSAASGESSERELSPIGLASLRPLPGSRREVEQVAGLFARGLAKTYFDGEVVKDKIRNNSEVSRAERIHFAVHGFLNESRPELSGLVLSDGLLSMDEIFNLELNADLVVLSACETALGQNVKGEGLIGISRALLYAGAAGVVVSLWQVADDSTPEFMLNFYRELNRSGDKAGALRLAKLKFIGEANNAHPYYWAPFILIGQPESAVTSRQAARH